MRGLTPIVLILVCICVGFFYINPQYKKIQAHRLESLEYDKVIAKSVELKKLRDSLSDTLQAFSPSDLDRISKLLPEKVDTARLILDISGVAAKYAIEMKDTKTTDAPKSGSPGTDSKSAEKIYKSSTISFGFQTSYEGMIQFVKDLEKSLRMVDVISISLKPSAGTFPIYDYNITLQAYWLNSK